MSPTFDAILTHSDSNRDVGDVAGRDLATEVRPGLQMSSRSGRIKGALSYTLGLIHHSNSSRSQDSETQHSLNAAFTAEAIENWAFVDATATVTRSAVSPYGLQSADGSLLSNSNRTDVARLSISPYLRGNLAGVATYEARLNASAVNARHSIAGDSKSSGGSLAINSARTGAVFGWGLVGTHQRSKFRAGRATEDDRVVASVSAKPDPELTLTLRGGQEATDVIGVQRVTYDNWGGGLRWTPTERTLVSIDGDHRYFGPSHRVVLEHRMPLSSLRFTSTRDAAATSDPTGVGQPVTLYQLFFNLFASTQPDPVLRDQLVRDFLRTQGQDPNAVVSGGFLNPAATLQRRDDLAWTYNGRRTMVTLQAFTSESSILDTSVAPGGGPVRQFGHTALVSYRLTPTAAGSLTVSRLRTAANTVQPGNGLKSIALGWRDQLGPHTAAALSARYSVFDSTAEPYREVSLSASLSLRF